MYPDTTSGMLHAYTPHFGFVGVLQPSLCWSHAGVTMKALLGEIYVWVCLAHSMPVTVIGFERGGAY